MQELEHHYDFVVVGAGLAGICAAITAARSGLSVALVNDRPVLGGNSSKEIRVPPAGARCCNFAYAKETGLVEELLLENLRTNPGCSPEGWNLVLLNAVMAEPKLRLFLNTSVHEVRPAVAGGRLESVRGYTLNAETFHVFKAAFFADCSGDGTVAALAGTPFRTGIEARSEFGESLCRPERQDFFLGCSIWFTTRDSGRSRPFERPPWVKREIGEADFGRYRPIVSEYRQQRGGFWWLELGADKDTVHEAPAITADLLALIYGVWDFLKNRSTLRAELETWELEWVGALPGKRESRRFEGDHILTQVDVETQRAFPDAVAYGGWGFDHHNRGGFFDPESPSLHVYHRGPYNIPLRSLYSRTVENLFLAGRNISASHYGLSTTRLMLTCAQFGEAIGEAAAIALKHRTTPKAIAGSELIAELQQSLLRRDHHIHELPFSRDQDLARLASIRASSTLKGAGLLGSAGSVPLSSDRLWQFPATEGRFEAVEILADVDHPTELSYRFWAGPASGSHYPDALFREGRVGVVPGNKQWLRLPCDCALPCEGTYFLEIGANPAVKVHFGRMAPVGFLAYDVRPADPIRPNPFSRWKLFKAGGAPDVWSVEDGNLTTEANDPWDGMVADAYLSRLIPEQEVFQAANVVNPWNRPGRMPNLWISEETNFVQPEWIELTWQDAISASLLTILFDSALDVHLTSLWVKYRRTSIPALIRSYIVQLRYETDGPWSDWTLVTENHQRRRVHSLPPRPFRGLRLVLTGTHGLPRAQVYSLRVERD